eukprot:CAMPEP_0185025494 /NCGR_PEP_ID=MMETSP1103-20130426/8428_1 /TAXON_ID=36769 /ORGANISM="Paraphysomonas bandaiensis, Strain Caron Lab Isolate" /LENGTH=74 /DNA_ID=CAMNT_0027558699 /DNA_START=645 /DNA_END=869 /DNA_ORIENTATION=-
MTHIMKEACEHTSKIFLPTFMVDCMFWPPVQMVNFAYVPVQYQVLWVNVAALFWNVFVSYMANKSSDTEQSNDK